MYDRSIEENMSSGKTGRRCLVSTVREFCDSRKINARVKEVTPGEVQLLDCGQWEEDYTGFLRRLFPRLEARVDSCGHSLSGFRVTLVSFQGGLEWAWLMCTGLELAAYLYMIFVMTRTQ
jgi:hypothetical protein